MDSQTQGKFPTGTKVVMVEDDKFLGSLVAKKLVAAGCDVKYVDNGEIAVATIEDVQPHVVLLDLLLPGMSGFDVLAKVKQNEKTKQIPVILLSNLGEKKDIEQGIQLGAANFLIKATMTVDEILDEAAKVVNSKK
ncbi:MAG: response regulator [Candidatus Paceibacterota bacterium]|jgi:DNA-binding response OmpR family regulator